MKTDQSTSGYRSEINVNIADFVLTPLSCSGLVNEILVNLLYQRTQIPYTFNWLKNIVEKKRQKDAEDSEKRITNFTVGNHYRSVSKAYDAISDIMKHLNKEFVESKCREVTFVIGVTPHSPKEVITIRVPCFATGHYDRNHILDASKKQHKVLRQIFLSQDWMDLIDNSVSCANTYVFLKRDAATKMVSDNNSIFLPTKPLFVPAKVRHTLINLNYDDSQFHECCDFLEVFRDVETPTKKAELCRSDDDDDEAGGEEGCWSQSSILIQGYKDCFINKVSASQLW